MRRSATSWDRASHLGAILHRLEEDEMALRGDHCPFHCGDRVFDKIDPRHVGRINSISGAFAEIEWRPSLVSSLPLRALALESLMLDPKIDWDDPEARFRLIEKIGPAAYKIAFEAYREQSVFATVNGYTLRRVQSRFGVVIAIDGTQRAFRNLAEAETYVRTLPRLIRETYERKPKNSPAQAGQMVLPNGPVPRRVP